MPTSWHWDENFELKIGHRRIIDLDYWSNIEVTSRLLTSFSSKMSRSASTSNHLVRKMEVNIELGPQLLTHNLTSSLKLEPNVGLLIWLLGWWTGYSPVSPPKSAHNPILAPNLMLDSTLGGSISPSLFSIMTSPCHLLTTNLSKVDGLSCDW